MAVQSLYDRVHGLSTLADEHSAWVVDVSDPVSQVECVANSIVVFEGAHCRGHPSGRHTIARGAEGLCSCREEDEHYTHGVEDSDHYSYAHYAGMLLRLAVKSRIL